jgi:membrane-bound lytic murein transglycosylase D
VAERVARANTLLASGLAAADEGHLGRARADLDQAVDLLLAHPGGALAEPRVAEAYRRALDTVHAREVEALAAEAPADAPLGAAAIVADLPVGEAPANPETLARAVAAVEAESLDLPIELNPAVLSCIDLYQGRLRDWFEAALSRGQGFLPHIREVFAEEGIPQDLAYVALVESAFKPTAYSRAKAMGVWQFIRATGRRYGLEVDFWVDERADPEKATRAAARYLKELHSLFGDWSLALAGYNAGEGKVLRAMKRYRTDDFWKLRETRGLRRETKNYVPLIHAAVVLAKAPERYGFTVAAEAPRDFERVSVEGALDLRVIAECAGEPVETLRALNPELRRLATPADRTFGLRVPPGRGEQVGTCVAGLPPEKRVAFRKHVVRRGQTFASIARANGTTAREVAGANGLALGRRLRPGTELLVPVPQKPRARQARRVAPPERPEGRGGQD